MRPDGQMGALQRRVLFHTLLCAIPAALLVVRGSARAAGLWFFAAAAVGILRTVVRGRPAEMICLLLAISPLVNLMRGYVFYNVLIVLFAAVLAFFALRRASWVRDAFRGRSPVIWLCAYLVAYYAASLSNTGDFRKNLRIFELCMGLVLVVLVGRRKQLLAVGLQGLILSDLTIALAMLPQLGTGVTTRLGMMVVDEGYLGNPITIGLPLALGLLALLCDRGSWLDLRRHPSLRMFALLSTAALLALTTSRTSWLVAGFGVALSFLLGRRQRVATGLAIVAVLFGVYMAARSPYEEGLMLGARRTFDENLSVQSRTSGRSDQWAVAFRAVTTSWDRLLVGYGPGSGPAIYARESVLVPGVRYRVGLEAALHSLFMQILVEAGLLGLVPLLIGFWIAGARIVRWCFARGLVFPFVCFVGYILIVLTVTGNDTISAAFLGIGALALPALPEAARYRQLGRRLPMVRPVPPWGRRGFRGTGPVIPTVQG